MAAIHYQRWDVDGRVQKVADPTFACGAGARAHKSPLDSTRARRLVTCKACQRSTWWLAEDPSLRVRFLRSRNRLVGP